jgi:membrane protease YdiL (CAAX protease family)
MFAAVVAAFFVGSLIASFVLLYAAHGHAENIAALIKTQLFPFALGQLVSYLPIIATVVVMLPWVAQRSLPALGLRPPTIREVGSGIAGGILMLVTVGAVGTIQSSFTTALPHQQVVVDFERSPHDAGYFLLSTIAIVFAPFTEELVFRGFVFNAFLRYVPFATAALASGTIFGALHIVLSGGGLEYAVFFPLSAGGIVLAYIYHRTGNLPSSMIAHGLFNGVTVVATLIGTTAAHVK